MSKISVIVPVYKVERYLRECVDSILQQSFREFDLILVDDGSPDTCPQICDDYSVQDPRIVVIHKKNGGLSDARNAGIDWAAEHSDSEWLAFVDSDDYLYPDYLMKMYQAAQKEAADLVISDYTDIDDRGGILQDQHGFSPLATDDKEILFKLLTDNWRVIPAWNKLYHKRIFEQLRFEFGKIHEDSFAIHHVLWNCRKAAVIPDALYYYRHRNNSIMATETPKSRLDALEAIIEQYEFRRKHRIDPQGASMPVEFLKEYSDMRSRFSKEEKKRYKQLKKRFIRNYFSFRSNRTPKRFLGVYFAGIYCRLSSIKRRIIQKVKRS